MRNTLQIVWVITVLIFVTACAPKIVSFQASPRRLCKGQSTVVSWDVKGHAVLLAEPAIDGTGSVPSSGLRNFTPLVPTMFKIRAMRSGKEDAVAKQEVVVFSSGDTQPIVIRTKSDSAGGLVSSGTIKPEVWDEMMRIDSISSQSKRILRVLHEGREVILSADGTDSAQMRGAKMSGLWEIYADLLPGEVIGDPAHAPPDRLRILINLTCINQEG